MNIKKHIFRILTIAAAAGFCACETSEIDESAGNSSGAGFEIVNSKYNYNFTEEQNYVFIPVRTSIPESQWKITEPADNWCKVSRTYDIEKGFNLLVEQNDDADIRTTSFKVGAGKTEYEISVRQLGYGPAILVDGKVVPQAGGYIDIEVTSNIECRMGNLVISEDDEPNWLTVANNGQPLSRAFADTSYRLHANFNGYPYDRTATVEFTAVDPMYLTDDVTAVCTIRQATGTVTAEVVYPDEIVPIAGGEDNQHHSGNGIENLWDGDMSTVYHSPWQVPYDDPTTTFPVTWEFYFDGEPTIDYFVLYSGTGNGRPGKFNVEYKLAGDSGWTMMSNALNKQPSAENPLFNFNQTGGTQTCRFPESLEGVTNIRISWYDGAGSNGVSGGFISSQEIEFYADMSADLNRSILEIFTDMSCSELRPGVTRNDITALFAKAPYLAQEVAMRLLNETYPEAEKEYRIHSYEAYSNGEELFRTLRTRRYTQMDNPTGIYVTAGQQLLICVDDVPAGQTLSLGIANENGDGYTAKYNGFQQKVDLFKGVNTVTANYEGMCYLLNTASNLTAGSAPVKVHFLPGCGRIEGYFDLARHTDADYLRLLGAATWKYFIAKGENMIFMMHTATLRQYAPTGIISGLTAWDDILGWQFELMGLAKKANGKWDRMVNATHFNNHMVAVSNTNPSAYMDASDYRINFSATTAIPKIISYELLNAQEDNTWGPAHEAGHVNQRAIMWKSNIESSNNLFSNYAIYRMGKYGSRGSKISDMAASFSNPDHKAWVLMGSSTHINEDTEVHMRMQWQLWNYFHRCGVDTDFWPRLFELMRTKYILPNGEPDGEIDCGRCQMMFAEAVSEAANMDFTDFFEVWGFWEPVDITYEQYGAARYNVTQSMISETKAKLAKYETKAPAIQYLEDRDVKDGVRYGELGYYTTYQNKLTVSGTPSYTLEGRHYTVTGATNAVAIELRRAASGDQLGELVYFANQSGFDVPSSVTAQLASLKVYAVQWDSKRIEATAK